MFGAIDTIEIAGSAMTALYLQLIVMVTFPIAALLILKVRTKGKITPFFVGGTVYVVFTVLIVFFLEFVTILIGASPSIDNSVILYCIYHAVVMGLSEETGRFLAFKVFMRGLEDKEVPLFYAIGHAAFDGLTIVAVPAFATVSFASSYMENGVAGMMAQNANLTSEYITEMVEKINNITVLQSLLTVGERIVWFAIHIALSVIICYGVRKSYKSYLWICVGIRALCSVPGSLISKGVFSNDVFGLIILTVIGLAVGYAAIKIYANQEKEYPNFFSLYALGKKGI